MEKMAHAETKKQLDNLLCSRPVLVVIGELRKELAAMKAALDCGKGNDSRCMVESNTARMCAKHQREHLSAYLGKQLAAAKTERDAAQAVVAKLLPAVDELLEVAALRGDSSLPHPADDDKNWTARMQDAWDELESAAESASEFYEKDDPQCNHQ